MERGAGLGFQPGFRPFYGLLIYMYPPRLVSGIPRFFLIFLTTVHMIAILRSESDPRRGLHSRGSGPYTAHSLLRIAHFALLRERMCTAVLA